MTPTPCLLRSQNSWLEVVDLGGNAIGDKGAMRLAHLLQSRRAVQLASVSLQLNQLIGDYGAIAIARALASGRSKLRQLDLGGNKVGNPGAAALLRAVSNSSLVQLWLDDNVGARCKGGSSFGSQQSNRSFGSCRSGIKNMRTAIMNGSLASFDPNLNYLLERWATSKQHEQAALFPFMNSWQGPLRSRILRQVKEATTADTTAEVSSPSRAAYFEHVYPLASPTAIARLAEGSARQPLVYFANAPRNLLRTGCEGHSWRHCRLDSYFQSGKTPPKVAQCSFFAPFRLPPGMCMRSEFAWDQTSRSGWTAAYPYASGLQDDSWAEVAHTREQSGAAWLYLTPGSGVFWNCGKSLRARNKVAAALLLAEAAPRLKRSPRLVRNDGETPAETLARAIESNAKAVCEDDHCSTFLAIFNSNRTDRNDNCYGLCSSKRAPLAAWLERAANNLGARDWQVDHMSASSVLDGFLIHFAQRLGYDSIQLTMQPQVWCGLGWTTEILDLRIRKHRAMDLVQRLSVRDPLDPQSGTSEPCIVRKDNASRRAFQLCTYCEGNAMEQVARCLHDVSRDQRGFTVYSQYPRHRFDACISGD